MSLIFFIGTLMVTAVVTYGFNLDNFDQLNYAKKSPDKWIVIKDLLVPAGKTLDLTGLQNNTVIEFTGTVTFGYQEWEGTLITLKGKNITVLGRRGHLLDGGGQRWWDGKGGNGGKKKPRFIQVSLVDSTVTGLHIKNSPRHCFMINSSQNLRVQNTTIDIKDGAKSGGHNTDGFGVSSSRNVTISNSVVYNQDDCFATTSGSDTVFENAKCVGGHGISIGSMGSGHVVERVVIRNCRVLGNTNGIRIKTRRGETGAVKNVTFDDIEMKDISKYGVVIQGNYYNSGPKGDPTPFPIENLVIRNVRGHVAKSGTNILVWVDPGSAKNWTWSSKITGGSKEQQCKGVPQSLPIRCGKK
uniref:endo-polygalacturonase n=2 Tax=Lygus hesperus TaxID=30085 RepID=A0A146KP56_LYGHE